MSKYALNKMLRDINQSPHKREQYFADASAFADAYDLDAQERAAFLSSDVGALYRLGAHGLILRPFTLLKQMPEAEYLRAIRS
jgi:hypothetical protein